MEGITPSRKGFTMISILKTAAGVAIGVLISGGITMGGLHEQACPEVAHQEDSEAFGGAGRGYDR